MYRLYRLLAETEHVHTSQAMLIMASVIRVGQSKFVNVPIDEDSSERIMNCIQTLSDLEDKQVVHDVFLKDTRTAYAKMLTAQEVCIIVGNAPLNGG